MRSGLSLLQALLVAASLLASQWLSLAPCAGEKARMACCASKSSCCCPTKEPSKAPSTPKRGACECTTPTAPEPVKALLPNSIDVAVAAPIEMAILQVITSPNRVAHRVPIETPPSTGPPLYLRHCRFLI